MGEKEEAIKLESTLSNRSNRSNRTAGSNGSPAIESAVTKPPTTKIAARLKLAVEEAVIDKNLSPGLVPLAQEYEKLKKQLRSLISCAKTYHQDSIQVQKSRDQVSILFEGKRLCWSRSVIIFVLPSSMSLFLASSTYSTSLTLFFPLFVSRS
jgi:hypothetical protein